MANLRKSLTTAERIRTNCKWPRSYHQKWTGFAVVQNTKDVHHDRPIVQAWKKAKIPWRLPGHSTVIMPIIPTLCKRLTVIPKDIPVVAITLTTPVQLAIILLHWKTHTNTNFQITTWKKTTYSQIHMYIWIKNTLRVTCISKYSVHNFHYNIYIYIQYVCIMLLLCLKLLRELYNLWNSSWILTQTTEALAVTWLVSR